MKARMDVIAGHRLSELSQAYKLCLTRSSIVTNPWISTMLPHNYTRKLLALVTVVVCVRAQTAPIVDLGYAQYQGTVDPSTSTTSFLGIRYAAPPLGGFLFRWIYSLILKKEQAIYVSEPRRRPQISRACSKPLQSPTHVFKLRMVGLAQIPCDLAMLAPPRIAYS